MSDTLTIPTTAAELEEMLGEPDKMQSLFKDQAKFAEFIKAYAKATITRDQSITQQVTEQTQKLVAEYLRENDVDIQSVPKATLTPGASGRSDKRQGLFAKYAAGAQLNDLFEHSGEFFKTIWHNTDNVGQVAEKRTKLRNAFQSATGSDGAFLIPETLRSELLRVALETSIVRSRARVVPMETARVPFPTVDATSNASSVYGGIVAYWTEEGGTPTETSPKFGRVTLDAKQLTAYTEVPNSLLSDSAIAMMAFINELFPEALAFEEDDKFLVGNGAGVPLGVLHASNSALIAVAKQTGQSADTIVWENLVKMYSRMLPTSHNRAVWLAHIDTFPELATMALSVGTGGSAIWLNNGAEGPPMTILGRPVLFTEKAQTLGDKGDINYIDLGHYLVGDRQAMSATSSPHFKFQTDETAFKIIERVDGRPWVQSAITPKRGSNTLSPYVTLAARA